MTSCSSSSSSNTVGASPQQTALASQRSRSTVSFIRPTRRDGAPLTPFLHANEREWSRSRPPAGSPILEPVLGRDNSRDQLRAQEFPFQASTPHLPKR